MLLTIGCNEFAAQAFGTFRVDECPSSTKDRHLMKEPNMSTPKLAHEIRLGSIKAMIWECDTATDGKYKVSVQRFDRHGDSRPSSFFQVDELPLVAEVVDLAHLWVFEQAELIA